MSTAGREPEEAAHLYGPHFAPLQERHPFSGHQGPLILGHEFMGRVVALGPGVVELAVGQRVAVGAGMCYPVPEGCSDEAAARALEPALLIAVDVDARRLERAAVLGASQLVQAGAEDVLQALRQLTDGEGPELVIEASGAASAPALALAAAQRGGRVLLVGLQAEPRALDLHAAVVREIELLTTNAHVSPVDLPEALALLSREELAKQVIDRVIPLERLVPDGLLALAEGQAHGKILLDPQS
ncbi:hypothetical protein A4R35_22870 [Thermogemmatispora tikiterensis]|uniref:Enoyl reductase (ER) domain-containing protein n=2 Tax=Thermogemmatispora tikiterensis TaxID=1825093 RepID=A0A328VQC0_9CHLR|nr:hypothetical protein A4R35_22870 [Thermogemmatispora tikiterensis]